VQHNRRVTFQVGSGRNHPTRSAAGRMPCARNTSRRAGSGEAAEVRSPGAVPSARAARALDPPVGWHVPEEAPRRAESGEGRRSPVAGGWLSACRQALDRQRAFRREACPSGRIRRSDRVGLATSLSGRNEGLPRLQDGPKALMALELDCRGLCTADLSCWPSWPLARALITPERVRVRK
jgi:hypothetical protein